MKASGAREKCIRCRTELGRGDGFVFCVECRAPHFLGDLGDSFAVLGAERAFVLDEKALETRYYELSRRLHPDRFAASDKDLLARSEELTAALNSAYQALRRPEERLEALLEGAGLVRQGERGSDGAQIPAALAEEFFEIQEAFLERPSEAARLAGDFRAKLESSDRDLTTDMYDRAARVDWTPPLSSVARSGAERIATLRRERSYVRSMLSNLERLSGGEGTT